VQHPANRVRKARAGVPLALIWALAGASALTRCAPTSDVVGRQEPMDLRTPSSAPGIAVRDNRLVTTSAGMLGVQRVRAGQPVVLRGVNFSGAEYACLQEHSFWDNPKGNQATVDAMLRWHPNVVRVPLNEECWLGINGAPARYSGENYANAIATFVRLANASGLIVEVDLHWGAGGSGLPTNDRYPGLDADHAPDFWRSVAKKFGNNRSVVFNLINEPYITSWACYRDGGCETPRVGGLGRWRVVGTGSVVRTIRSTGAANPIIVAGLNFSNDLSRWLEYAPPDPDHAILAGAHVYFDDLGCEDPACWTREFAAIAAAGYPLVVDEFGEFDCGHAEIDRLMDWADAQTPRIGYWAWSWNPFSCARGPSLITDDAGSPTHTYGSGFRRRLERVQ
jgi:endoglucanase